jgi:hypothetical protein
MTESRVRDCTEAAVVTVVAASSTRTEHSRESWQAANKAVEQAIHFRS